MYEVSALCIQLEGGAAEDDAALVRSAVEDPAAFDALYRRYRHRVYSYLRTRTPTEQDAADLTQQVFLQALDHLPAFRGSGSGFAPWLFRIARNASIDLYRRKRVTVTWDLIPAALHPAPEGDLESNILHQEALTQLRSLVAALPPDRRELLALRFGARLTVPEIARVIGKSESATQKRLNRMVQTLKEQYHGCTP